MKKSTKLLSVILAIVMLFSCMSVMASAYGDYKNVGEEFYDTNDNPRTFLYTDEQRASIVMDLLDNLLGSLAIKTKVLWVEVDLTSYNGVIATLNDGTVDTLLGSFGQLKYLNYSKAKKAPTREAGGDIKALDVLLGVVGDSKALFYNILNDGKIDLGLINNFVDLSSVNGYLNDLPSTLGGVIYGLGQRQLPIGDDPELPNDKAWADLTAKPTFDTMLQDIIVGLLTEPNGQERITDVSQNTLASQALTEETVDEDGKPVTYYYCYGVDKDGALITKGEEKNKVYLTHWDKNSALVKGDSATTLTNLITFTGKDLYTMLEEALPWAYDTYGAPNLDGQLRATLMQFCGAYNAAVTDETIQAQLKEKVEGYKAIQDANGAKALSEAFAKANGDAGNYNFMYLTLDNADGSKKIDKTNNDLYYVVEWDGGWEFYHVEFPSDKMSAFFDMADWEYQISDWASLTTEWTSGTSVLQYLNNIVGRILKQAVPSVQWTEGTNANIEANVVALMKQFIKADPQKIFGKAFVLPTDFDNYDLEDLCVMIAKVVMGHLMPSLVLPETVSSIEEVLVYGLREYMAEILPEYGAKWDAQIAAATTEEAYLNIALNMGASTGMYYLRNLIGVGTYASRNEVPPIGPDYSWQEILNYVIDWVMATWVPGLTTNIKTKYPSAFSGTDPLAKLSAVASTLFPTVGKLLGCSSETYAVDLQVLYNTIRPILNGQLNQIATALQRQDTGVGKMNVCTALVTLIEELFGGLGFDTQGDNWTSLKALLDNATKQAEPIQALIGAYGTRTSLANLAQYLVACLAYSKNIWLQDGIKIITSFVGGFTNELANNGFTYTGADAYTGATSFTVNYSITSKVSGVKTYFNDGRYKTGAGGFDGTYRITVVRSQLRNAAGATVSTQEQNATFSANETVNLSLAIPESAVPTTPGLFTVETVYKLQLPDGSWLDNGAEQTFSKQIIVTSLVNDNLTPLTMTLTRDKFTSSGSQNRKREFTPIVDIVYKNTYLSERDALSDAEKIMLTINDHSVEYANKVNLRHDYVKMFIPGYGYHFTDDKGKISIHSADDATSSLVDLTGKLDITKDGEAIDAQTAWFKWNVNMNSLNQTGAVTKHASGSVNATTVTSTATCTDSLWVTEPGTVRSDFTADFTTYKITASPTVEYDYGSVKYSISSDETDRFNPSFTSYINIYNSYNLEKILGDVLDKALQKENYDTSTAEGAAAWKAYEDALSYAMTQMYGQWVAASFAADHTTTMQNEAGENVTVSTFKKAGDDLQAAVADLANYTLKEASAAKDVVAPSDPASDLYPVYQAVQRMDAQKLKNQDYVLYRWYKYYDLRAELGNLLASATPPSGVAENKLAGVPSDLITEVVATLPADIQTIANAMVVTPTAEEQAAAAQALEDFVMPNYDATSALAKAGTMETNGNPSGRLLPKYDSCQYYYLDNAITNYGTASAADYTAESYQVYSDALANANTVLREAKANATSQSTIHAARYDLLVAYNALIRNDESADFMALEASYNNAMTVLKNQSLFQATAESGMTTAEALKALLAATGYATTYEDVTYYVGGSDTGAAVLAQKGKLTEIKKQDYIDWVKSLIDEALANIESKIKMVPNDSILDNPTKVQNGGSYVVDGIKPGTINSEAQLLALVKTTAPEGYTANLAVTRSAANGFGTGTKVVLTVNGIDGFEINHTVMVYGDVNGDGAIDAFDAALIDMNVSGAATLTGDFATAGDATADDAITLADYELVRAYAIGADNIAQTRP